MCLWWCGRDPGCHSGGAWHTVVPRYPYWVKLSRRTTRRVFSVCLAVKSAVYRLRRPKERALARAYVLYRVDALTATAAALPAMLRCSRLLTTRRFGSPRLITARFPTASLCTAARPNPTALCETSAGSFTVEVFVDQMPVRSAGLAHTATGSSVVAAFPQCAPTV